MTAKKQNDEYLLNWINHVYYSLSACGNKEEKHFALMLAIGRIFNEMKVRNLT